MTKLKWDQVGERVYETGVDHGVLYLPDAGGNYSEGYAWNGLTTVTESPSGAESNKQYADNRVYLNLLSAEEFSATVEAFTYPDKFAECDGTAVISGGVAVGQQTRKPFGLSYRTLVGNDVVGTDLGYKLHLVYGAVAAPTEKAHGTVNDSPEAMAFSWDVSTTPVDVDGTNPDTGLPFKPTATLTIDSTKVDAAALTALENSLYGTDGADPVLPLPGAVLAMFAGTLTTVATAAPTYDPATDIVTIPGTVGVVYMINGEPVTGTVTITEDTVVTARAADGYTLSDNSDTDWTIYYA